MLPTHSRRLALATLGHRRLLAGRSASAAGRGRGGGGGGDDSRGSSDQRASWYERLTIAATAAAAGAAVALAATVELRQRQTESRAALVAAASRSSGQAIVPPAGINHIADVVEQVSPAAVTICMKADTPAAFFGKSSYGSGFIISEDGLVLTNAHVVPKLHASLKVLLRDGRELPGKVLAADIECDMALLKIEAGGGLPTLPLGSSKNCRAGEWVIAVGSPLTLNNTVTAGIISNTARNIGKNIEYLQTDASITAGNSGGPLVDMNGRAIGINTMKVDSGIAFAIPIDEAKNFIEQALTSPKKKLYLGLTILSLTPHFVQQVLPNQPLNLQGVLVWQVHSDSPAEEAGLLSRDVIIAVNGQRVKRTADFNRYVTKATGDGHLELKVIRNAKEITLSIQPEFQS